MSIFDRIKRLFGGMSTTNGNGARVDPESGGPAMDEVEMIPCEEALRLVHDYLDGELEGVPRSQVRRHFEACARCYPYLGFESAYREAVRRAGAGESAPAELKTKVLELLDSARSEE